MGVPVLTAFDLTKYAGVVSQEYNSLNLLRDNFMITRDLMDAAQSKIPIIVKRTAGEVAPASSRIAGTGTTEKSATLSHNASIEASEILPYESLRKLPWNIMEEYGKRLAADVAAAQMIRFINYLAGRSPTSSPNHLITSTFLSTDANLAIAARDGLKDAASLFDVQNFPRMPWTRIMILHPNLFNELFTLGEVVRKDFGNVGGVRDFGMGYLEYAGWHIFQNPTGFNTNSSSLGDSNTPDKYKKNLTAGGLATGAVYGIGWYKPTIAQGYATFGPSHLEIEEPYYNRDIKSWCFNAALLWDIVQVQENAESPPNGIGIVRFDDDGS